MTIQITIKYVLDHQDVLKEISRLKMPSLASFRFSKVFKIIDAEMVEFEKARLSLFKEYGETKDGGATYTPKLETAAKLMSELDVLFAEIITIDFVLLPMSIFNSVELSPAQAEVLSLFIDENLL